MSSIGCPSPFQITVPDEVKLKVFSFLDKRNLQSIACTCKQFNGLSEDFQIWKLRTTIEFGKFVADGAKQSNKSWKRTYDELDSSRKVRVDNIPNVIQAQVKKKNIDNLQYRTARSASVVFGFAMPNLSTHYYFSGQKGCLGNRKITVFKTSQ
jgi:F-box-like